MKIKETMANETSTEMTKKDFQFFLTKEAGATDGYSKFVTMQPVNKSDKAGYFVQMDQLSKIDWTAKIDDFDANTVTWNYLHTFGTKKDIKSYRPNIPGLLFNKPKIQIVLRSPLLVREKHNIGSGLRQIIGTFNDPEVKKKFDDDKGQIAAASITNSHYSSKYEVVTKYLVYILDMNNRRCHKTPMVLIMKGLNGVNFADRLKEFEKDMTECLKTVTGDSTPYKMNEKFFGTCIFEPDLIYSREGMNDTQVVWVDSYTKPIYKTAEEALMWMNQLSIPAEDRASTWEDQGAFDDYINMHSLMEQKDTGGAYGLAPGVEVKPNDRATALPSADAVTAEVVATGEDARL